jgi:hypothetical protein
LTTPRAIYGNNFDGSAALTQVIASTYGGTGNGFTKFSGPTTAERTFTLPDSNATLLYSGGALGTPASGTVTNLTGTASININGSVGATTANTGAFTTLSASGQLAMSSDTAVFRIRQADLTQVANFGMVKNILGSGTDTNFALSTIGTFNIYPSNTATNVAAFSSTGLAVTGALSATGASTIQNTFTITRSSATARTLTLSLENGTADYITDAAGAYPHRFFVGATKYAQIDTTGLAVSANNGSILLTRASGSFGLRIKQDNTLGEINFQTKLSDDTTWQSYIKVGEGNSSANSHLILQPTAGNVGIGTSSPAANLDVRGANKIFDSTGIVNVYATDTTTVGYGGSIALGGNNGTGGTSPYPYAKIQGIKEGSTSTWSGALVFGTTASNSAVTERMRIDSSGNVGIGVTPSANTSGGRALEIGTTGAGIFGAGGASNNCGITSNAYGSNYHDSGVWKYARNETAGLFEANGNNFYWMIAPSGTAGNTITFTQAMTLNSTGFNFFNGGTNPASSGASKNGLNFGYDNNTEQSWIQSNRNNISETRTLQLNPNGGNVYVGNLGTGLVYSSSGNLTSTNPSDARLKTDISDIDYGLSSIIALRPVSYKWKSDKVNQGTQYGFIAQEVQTVMPDLVKEFETTEDGETVTRLGLEKEGIYAAMVKALQELNANLVAQVAALSQRLAALEGK